MIKTVGSLREMDKDSYKELGFPLGVINMMKKMLTEI